MRKKRDKEDDREAEEKVQDKENKGLDEHVNEKKMIRKTITRKKEDEEEP